LLFQHYIDLTLSLSKGESDGCRGGRTLASPGFASNGIAAFANPCYQSRHAERAARALMRAWPLSSPTSQEHMPPRKTGARTGRARTRPARNAVKDDGLDTAFVDALAGDFLRHGAVAIAKMREDDPATYMKLCAQVLPRSLLNNIDPLEAMSDEELRERARQLAEKTGLGARPDTGRAGSEDEPGPARKLPPV
jgi:hypothetical protein